MTNNCLSCRKFSSCAHDSKSASFVCSSFKPFKADSSYTLDLMPSSGVQSKMGTLLLPSTIDNDKILTSAFAEIESALEAAIENELPVPKDLKIDDSDFPLAKNFYDYALNETWGWDSIKPFARQLWVAIKLFGEYCVAEGSYIQTEFGLKKIEDLCDRNVGMSPKKFRVATSDGSKGTSHAGLTSNRRKCITISSRGGDSVTVTPEHKVLVFTADRGLIWKEARDITTDDYLTSKIGTNLWPTQATKLPSNFVPILVDRARLNPVTKQPTKTSPNLARFVGYLLSDGSFDEYSVRFCKPRKELRDDFVNIVHELFGVSSKTSQYLPKSGSQVCYTSCINNKTFSQYLVYLGINVGNCYTKTVPSFIETATREEAIQFLKALFDCDGYIQPNRVGIVMSNKNIIDVVSLLLNNLGIYHTRNIRINAFGKNPQIKVEENRELKEKAYEIEIRGDAQKFCSIVGTNNLHRTKVCAENASNKRRYTERRARTHYLVKPGDIPYFKQYLTKLNSGKYKGQNKDLRTALGLSSQPRTNAVNLSKLLTTRFEDYCHRNDFVSIYEELKQLHDHSYVYHKVDTIEDAGYHKVYDLTVPSVENFLCNGIVVHNCPRCTAKRAAKLNIPNPMTEFTNIPVDASPQEFKRRVVLLEHGVCPKCNRSKSRLVKKERINFYTTLAMACGQRAGKSQLSAMLTSYIVHMVIKMQKPSELLTGISSAVLTGSFVSPTKAGSITNLWQPFVQIINESKWWAGYFDFLRDQSKRYGYEVANIKDSFFHFKHRNLFISPQVSDQRALRGYTRIFQVLDEVGWLSNNSDLVTLSADGLFEALDNSLLTVRVQSYKHLMSGFSQIPTAYSICVSSPSAQDDFIMRMVRNNVHSKSVLAIHSPTWEINPVVSRNSPELTQAYLHDPVAAEKNYGANPPSSANPFITDISIVRSAFSDTKNRVRYEYHTKKAVKSDKETVLKYAMLTANNPPTVIHGGVMALDAGLNNNSFALTISHLEDKYLVYDVLIEVAPEKGREELSYPQLTEQLIYPLIKAFNVKYLLADRWNSVFLLQKASEDFPGLIAEQYSVKKDDFTMFKSFLEGGRMLFPALESDNPNLYEKGVSEANTSYPHMFRYMPSCHLFNQLLTVQQGLKTVDKGFNKTDDIFRAVVLASSYLLDEKVAENLGKLSRKNMNHGLVASGLSSTFSGSSFSNGKVGIVAKM